MTSSVDGPSEELIEQIRQQAFEEAALACQNFMVDCLDDRDIQKNWQRIRSNNETYAGLVRNLAAASLKILSS